MFLQAMENEKLYLCRKCTINGDEEDRIFRALSSPWRIGNADPMFPFVNDELELIINGTPFSYYPYLCIPVTNFFPSAAEKI